VIANLFSGDKKPAGYYNLWWVPYESTKNDVNSNNYVTLVFLHLLFQITQEGTSQVCDKLSDN
jgi:hypothetical protein